MNATSRKDVERLLSAHYRAERGAPDAAGKTATLAAVRAEAAAGTADCETSSAVSFAGFVAAQARFIHLRVWAAQLVLVVAMIAACAFEGFTPNGLSFASGVLAAATVLVGLPDLVSSAAHRVAELEYACRFDCRAVALARLIVLGCADVVAVTAIALAAPVALGADPFASLVHACVPFFLTCAGALLIVRRCAPVQALPLACVWALLVMAAAYGAFMLAPDLYALASTWAWALVAAASLLWTAREVRAWLAGIAGGLDVFSPSSSALR
ncbi:hypothetical protein [Arabiibacter massiliensis]|uniref:hypothetical protein n=1 Tax=Arabiibacter massiliensis TaxID=1870985 RepID=UPI0009BB00A2|nr:hypothetical protein [Arabiibacter massiliensis]